MMEVKNDPAAYKALSVVTRFPSPMHGQLFIHGKACSARREEGVPRLCYKHPTLCRRRRSRQLGGLCEYRCPCEWFLVILQGKWKQQSSQNWNLKEGDRNCGGNLEFESLEIRSVKHITLHL